MSREMPKTQKREIKYKWSKILLPSCPICEEFLTGNNSSMFPFQCKCGTWKSDWKRDNLTQFFISPPSPREEIR